MSRAPTIMYRTFIRDTPIIPLCACLQKVREGKRGTLEFIVSLQLSASGFVART